jgi:hypothetical protein
MALCVHASTCFFSVIHPWRRCNNDVCSFANNGEWRREDGAFVICTGMADIGGQTDRVMIYKVGGADGFESCSLWTGSFGVYLSDPFQIQAVYCLYGDPWNGVSIPINVLKTSLSRCVSCINNTYSADTGRRIVKIPKSGGLRTVQS